MQVATTMIACFTGKNGIGSNHYTVISLSLSTVSYLKNEGVDASPVNCNIDIIVRLTEIIYELKGSVLSLILKCSYSSGV